MLPLLLKLAGALVPAGSVIVVVIGPVVGPVPLLVTVIGTLLGCPSTKAGDGCPIVVVKSATGKAETGVLAVIGEAALLLVTVSPGVVVVPLNGPGCVPTVLAFGVTGTWIVLLPPAAIGPGLIQVTVWPLVVQLLPLLLKLAGALVLAGSVIVVVIGPVVGALPLLVTVIGTLLGRPATKLGEG